MLRHPSIRTFFVLTSVALVLGSAWQLRSSYRMEVARAYETSEVTSRLVESWMSEALTESVLRDEQCSECIAEVDAWLEAIAIPPGVVIAITDLDLRFLGRRPVIPGAIGRSIDDPFVRDFLADARAGDTVRTIRRSRADGTERVYTGRRHHTLPLFIIVGEDHGPILARWTRQLVVHVVLLLFFLGLGVITLRATRRVEESEARFRAIVDAPSCVPIQGYDASARVLFWNRASELTFGYGSAEVMGAVGYDLVDEDVAASHRPIIERMFATGISAPPVRLTVNRPDGSKVVTETHHVVVDLPDGRRELYCIDHDITEIEALHRRLREQATTDDLTGLPNRRYLMQRGAQETARAERHEVPLSLAMIDIDFFKSVNDRHGHAAGDSVLKELAALLHGAVRESDLVARLGGEEFAVLLPHTALDDATQLADRLRIAVEEHVFVVLGHELRLTVSVGVASCEGPCAMDQILGDADDALYRAKAAGRNRVVEHADA